MSATTMKITKVKEHIGAIATGIDLAQPIDAATVENVVLVIRGQQRRLYRILVGGDRPY